MAYKSEWSLPSLEERGFPKKDAVLSFSWGTTNRGGSWATNPGSSRADVKNFLVTRNTDANSGLFFTACAAGTSIPQIKVFLEKVEGNTTYVYATYAFENCSISSVYAGGSDEKDKPLESIGVTFEKVSYEYKKS